jgi:hypothetical protein
VVRDVSSLILVDNRPYRKIAQDNWGLTSEQMRGMHVHHRIPVSEGGTNDPSNLYVCSPYFHKHVWHDGQEWIDWASSAGSLGGAVSGKIHAASGQLSTIAKLSHEKHRGTPDYSARQLLKSLKSHVTKRRKWTKDLYERVAQDYSQYGESGYKTAKRLGITPWKQVSNMIECIRVGFTFEEIRDPEKYVSAYFRRVKLTSP